MTKRNDQLNAEDMDTLRFAARMRRDFDAGIHASNAGQRSHFKRLKRLELIEVDRWGVDLDNHLRDVLLYKLTVKGEAKIAAFLKAEAARLKLLAKELAAKGETEMATSLNAEVIRLTEAR